MGKKCLQEEEYRIQEYNSEYRRQKTEVFGTQDNSMFCRQECCGVVVWCAVACRNVCRGARTTVGVDEKVLAYLQDGLELFVWFKDKFFVRSNVWKFI